MLGDIKLKIRHAKRGNEKYLDLSGFEMLELPADITQLTMLESLNLSNNKLTNLKKVEQLPNLKELNASNNNIQSLHQEMLDMYSIETLYLIGNPIVNNHPQLVKIENNQTQLKKALEQYFGVGSSKSISGISQIGNSNIYAGSLSGIGVQNKSNTPSSNLQSFGMNQFGSSQKNVQSSLGGAQQVSFLQGEKNMNDPAVLRKMIADLELENRKLKESDNFKGNNQFNQSFYGQKGGNQDKDWMKFGSQPLERPTTANVQNQKSKELEEELKYERKEKKKLFDEIENLKHELQKSNFSAFTSTSSAISVSLGRLPQVPGVREITLEDIEIGEQISQGGFSVIHKGTLNGTQVAIKKIFDPRLTDDLLNEIYNEIVMQSILRHPNIALLMGVMPKIPNIIIVFELMSQGSLYNLLHLKKSVVLNLDQRLKIAKDIAMVLHYMHSVGIVHRDIKSHNILVDENNNIKLCDFGLARFKSDLNKGTMQYSGTPAYMAPELFQKRQYDESVDIFAYGTLLWELVCREVPYDGLDPSDIRQKVEKEEAIKAPYGTDPRLVQLINDCRQGNAYNRPMFGKIMEILSLLIK